MKISNNVHFLAPGPARLNSNELQLRITKYSLATQKIKILYLEKVVLIKKNLRGEMKVIFKKPTLLSKQKEG